MKTLLPTDETYDVVVLGSGISGGLVSVVMANKGYKVIMIDGAAHPKFAIGESTIPNTSQTFELLGKEHNIPEILALAQGPEVIRERVGGSCGIKRVVVFLYHREGDEVNTKEANIFGNIWRDENHLYRQDVDAYLFRAAIGYGADALENTRVTDVEFSDEGVTVETNTGRTIRGRFLVDGTGPRSPLVKKLGLHEQPTSLMTNTRTIFTHMINVTPFEECVTSPYSVGWSKGTCHHVFEGGWFWIIPFNNWEGATNQAISVGLTLDRDKYPVRDDVTPEQEFAEFLAKFPSIERQFADARAIRPWVRVPKLQYSPTEVVGDRFCLMAHTCGFVDPLYSLGLVMTVNGIQKLIGPLCEALDKDEFSRDNYKGVEAVMTRTLRYADKVVRGSYVAWRDYDLWNAWVRVWAIGFHTIESIMGSHLIMGKYSKYELIEDPITSEFEPEGYREFVEAAFDVIKQVDDGGLEPKAATEQLWKIIKEFEFEIRLRPEPEFNGAEWAMKAPGARDCFLGIQENHRRWQNGDEDPWLVEAGE